MKQEILILKSKLSYNIEESEKDYNNNFDGILMIENKEDEDDDYKFKIENGVD